MVPEVPTALHSHLPSGSGDIWCQVTQWFTKTPGDPPSLCPPRAPRSLPAPFLRHSGLHRPILAHDHQHPGPAWGPSNGLSLSQPRKMMVWPLCHLMAGNVPLYTFWLPWAPQSGALCLREGPKEQKWQFVGVSERVCRKGRERGRQNPKQAPGSEPSARSLTWGWNPQTVRYDPSRSRTLNRLSHPGAPHLLGEYPKANPRYSIVSLLI